MKRILLFLFLLILLPISVVIQDTLPSIPSIQSRLQLLPVVFCFGALALPLPLGLYFGVATALVQWCSLCPMQSDQEEFGLTLPILFFLSWTIILHWSSALAQRIRWEIHAIGTALVTFFLLSLEFVLLCMQRGGFPVDLSILLKILVSGAAGMLISPFLYFAFIILTPAVSEKDPMDHKNLPKATEYS